MHKKTKPFFVSLLFVGSCLTACQETETLPNAIISEATAVVPTVINASMRATLSPADAITLGKTLFWDPILSGKKDIACATCHHPANGYAENIDLSIGTGGVGLGTSRRFVNPATGKFVKRNSMTILNTVFNGADANGNANASTAPMFWDSRTLSLEAQSVQPMITMEEMRGNAYSEAVAVDSVVARLKRIPQYQQLFQTAFGTTNAITAQNMSIALASFERSLVANNSRFDRYKRGETNALTALEVQGMNAFQTAGCATCHSGNMFSDFQLHVLSVPDNAKNAQSDAGANNTYAFRTPSLRNASLTAPFMHSGVFANLGDVLRFYARVSGNGARPQNPNVRPQQLDNRLRNLRIGNNQQAIIAFINSLTDTNFDKTIPTSVPSNLPVGGNIR